MGPSFFVVPPVLENVRPMSTVNGEIIISSKMKDLYSGPQREFPPGPLRRVTGPGNPVFPKCIPL